ncbi:MAG: transporter substrate-binding domain-containing protein [Bacillota bacterium]|nr:transporter substrate-binding domain-containing protein [Bacillota bacterium]
MRKYEKILTLVIVLGLILGLASCSGKSASLDQIKKNGKIVMLTNAAFPPYEYLGDDNKPAGVDVDIANELAKELGVKLEIVNMDFDGLISALASGKGDFIAAGMTISDERKKSVDFSVEYSTSRQYIVMPTDGTFSALTDLKGKRIGVQLGTTGDYLVTDAVNGTNDDKGTHTKGELEGSGASVSEYKTALEAALDLKAGRLDAVVIDKLPAEIIAQKNDLKTSASAISDEEKYAYAVKKGNKELLDAINKTLNSMIKDGKVEELIKQHTK